ncbi:MAG: hypothetical protein ACR2OR_00640 [Hyphomicrobiales bacterium]
MANLGGIAGLLRQALKFFAIFSLLCVPAGGSNFSQYPGFAKWYAQNPPSDEFPSASDNALLAKHRPVVFLPKGHDGLAGFYEDYIAGGILRDGSGKIISRNVTQDVLNAHKNNPGVKFSPARFTRPNHSSVFARISRVNTNWAGQEMALTFLTYHLVFARSGLPGGLLGWQILALGAIGNLKDWHQLDHYTAVTLILDGEESPIAVMFQQHNNLRTHIIGETISLNSDMRPEVDVAIGSNELFPHRDGRTNYRAVPFPTPPAMRYLIGSGGRPFLTADDITHPHERAEYELRFVAPSDAFYTFKGYLGEKRLLPGRDGPPGADFNTLPDLKPLDLQMLSGYWREKNQGDIFRLERALKKEKYWLAFAEAQRDVFFANAACAQRWGENCAFD